MIVVSPKRVAEGRQFGRYFPVQGTFVFQSRFRQCWSVSTVVPTRLCVGVVVLGLSSLGGS